MKCICRRRCQIRLQGKIITVKPGQVIELDECPDFFSIIKGEVGSEKEPEVNFLKASRDELMAAKWKFKDAVDALRIAYGKVLTRDEDDKKKDIVERIMDIRYRKIDTSIVKEN